MVRKNNDNGTAVEGVPPQCQQPQQPQQRYGGRGVVAFDFDLIELNADGTRRNNNNHHLKISPASAFKKAGIKKHHHNHNHHHHHHHSPQELSSLYAPPLVLVGDNHTDEGGGEGEGDEEEVVMALFKDDPKEQQVAATATATATATADAKAEESVHKNNVVNHITRADNDNDNDKNVKLRSTKLHDDAYLQESEWKQGQLFPTQQLQAIEESQLHKDDFEQHDQLFEEETTPLHTVCGKGPSPQQLALLLLLLLEAIPEGPHDRKRALLQKDAISGNTPLHLACANLDHSVDFTVIKNLLLLAPEALDQTNHFGDSPLHLLVTSPGFARSSSSSSGGAVQSYDFSVEAAAEEAISSLLQMVGHLGMVQNYSGLTLLHCAIAHGAHERVLVKLLSMAPLAASIPDNRGMLPIHFVAAFGGKHGGTPWTFVSQLIAAYEHGIVAQTENGDTALHLLLSNAAQRTASEGSFLNRNTTKLAEMLVTTTAPNYNYNNNNNTGSSNNSTSSSTSSTSGYCLVSPLLIKNKVDLTPLHCCALFDTPVQLTRLIMESAPNSIAEQASAITTRFGATPVHLACASAKPDSNIQALATRLACCTRDEKDRTPLVVAVQNEKMPGQYIKEIIAIYPQAVDQAVRKGQYLPLHLAIKNTHGAKESVIRNLLKQSPKTIQAVTRSGNTALHVACQQAHPNATIIKLLLERYRDASRIRNKAGKLPIELVVKNSKSLLKKVPGLMPGENNCPLVVKSTSTSSSNKPTSSSSSSKKKKDHLHHSTASSSSSSKKKKAAAAVDDKSLNHHHIHHHNDHAAGSKSRSSSSTSTVHSTDGSEEQDCDISDKVSCLTEPTC